MDALFVARIQPEIVTPTVTQENASRVGKLSKKVSPLHMYPYNLNGFIVA
jgi:hypothetical protein